MTVEEIKGEDRLQLNVAGKIDSLSCNEFQNAVLTSFQKDKNVVINMEKVEYISSAGLRALILGHKTAAAKGGSLVIINLTQAVSDVIRVTGMDAMLNIR